MICGWRDLSRSLFFFVHLQKNITRDGFFRIKKSMRYILILFVTVFIGLTGWGNDNFVIELTDEGLSRSQGEFCGYFKDDQKQINTLHEAKSVQFIPTESAIPDFNFTTARYWIKFDLRNKTSFDDFILETGRPVTNNVECFVLKNGEVLHHYQSGDDYSYYAKEIEHRKNLFPIALDTNESVTIYLKFESDGELLFTPIIFHDHMGFFAQDFKDQFKNGFYFGLISLVVIIYFFFFVFLRDQSFLFYILYAFSQGVLQFSLDGFTHHHFFPNGGYLTNHVLLVFAGFTVIFLLTYVDHFLQLKTRNKRLYKIFLYSRIVMGAIIIMSLIPGTPYQLAFPIINGASLFAVLLGAFSIIYLRLKGFRVDIFFSIAFIILIIGGVVFILGNMSIVGDKIISLGALKLSSAFEFVILSISMSNKYGKLQREKRSAQEIALKNLRERNEAIDILNVGLEKQVKERTKQLEVQKEELRKSTKEIFSSIKYAERIQNAILPSEEQIAEILPNSYIFYRPKDVVSGDFYFVESVRTSYESSEEFTVFAAVDCTGHGVPGAFMSIVGHNLLMQSLKVATVNSPGEALDYLNSGVERTLRSQREGFIVRDGMDIAMCALSSDRKKIMFSGARNSLYLIRKNHLVDQTKMLENMTVWESSDTASLIEVKAIKRSIGNAPEKDDFHFENYNLDVFESDQLILFSDGFPDQFGGPKIKKYSYKRFRETLLYLYDLPLDKQQKELEGKFLSWQGSQSQTDDVLVISVKI